MGRTTRSNRTDKKRLRLQRRLGHPIGRKITNPAGAREVHTTRRGWSACAAGFIDASGSEYSNDDPDYCCFGHPYWDDREESDVILDATDSEYSDDDPGDDGQFDDREDSDVTSEAPLHLVKATSARGCVPSASRRLGFPPEQVGIFHGPEGPPDAGWMALPEEVRQYNAPRVELTIPPGNVEIGASAFRDIECLRTVDVPHSVERVGVAAFLGCKHLREVRFVPGRLKEVGAFAFADCEALRHVSLPEGCTTVCTGAFEGCSNLRTFEFPASFTGALSVPDPVFAGCRMLTELGFKSADAMAAVSLPACWQHDGNSFHGIPRESGLCLRLPPIRIRTLGGHEHTAWQVKIPVWFEHTFDLNIVVAAELTGTELSDPAQYELVAIATGSTEVVPLSRSRGDPGAAGLRRMLQGGLDLDSLVAVFIQE